MVVEQPSFGCYTFLSSQDQGNPNHCTMKSQRGPTAKQGKSPRSQKSNRVPIADLVHSENIPSAAPPIPNSTYYEPQEQEVAQLLTGLRHLSHPSNSRESTPAPPMESSFPHSQPTPQVASSDSFMDMECEPSPSSDGCTSPHQRTFISRVSSLPVVNATFRTIGEVYETSKNSSRVIRYSAETMESSMKTLFDNTKPVLSRFEPNLERLDEFAQRQLDRLERSYPGLLDQQQQQGSSFSQSTSAPPFTHLQQQQYASEQQQQQQQSYPGTHPSMITRWNSYLSAESMRSLKYCLEWLQFATHHIDRQIHVLRDAMNRLATNTEKSASGSESHITGPLASLLALASSVKKEVVETLRKVVEVIGKYAGNALPLEARNAVRGFILDLPSRWMSIKNSQSAETATNRPEQEAHRVLSLAHESSSVLRSTTAVFSQSVSTAEYLFGQSPSQNVPYQGSPSHTNDSQPQQDDH